MESQEQLRGKNSSIGKGETLPGKSSLKAGSDTEHHQSAPQITLPKGGGALKGIDEKFTVNAANGTCSFSIPLPLSKSRSVFAPSLALGYNSGSGNSAFGLGWSMELPSIQRKTDKQLPRYQDDNPESDVFMFGPEDLVPAMIQDQSGNWEYDDITTPSGISVKRYQHRIESSFARIERIQIKGESGCFWKVTTRDNTVTLFGKSPQARIADPADDTRIFKWLPELSYDDKGNCIEYEYKPEDLVSVPLELHEKNRRLDPLPFSNKYLKRVRYGNKNPYYAPSAKPYNPDAPVNPEYLFELVCDYFDHDRDQPLPGVQKAWECRFDPFSDCRAGFEIRTYRLCRRILFYNYFKELSSGPGSEPYLVRSLNLSYKHFQSFASDEAAICCAEEDFITFVQQFSYRKNSLGAYDQKGLPPVEFQYHELEWNTEIKQIAPECVVNAPVGLSGNYQWVDFYNEGISGILTEQAGAWYYKSNLGNGSFSIARPVAPKPSLTGIAGGALQIQDLEASGKKYIVSHATALMGYFEQTDDEAWLPFRPFEQVPNIDLRDPNVKFIDLNGDGMPDLLVSEEEVFTWYLSLGTIGFDAPEPAIKPLDEEQGPRIVFADGTQSIFLADMSGDGLTDIVRIRNGELCYWPNLGYGRFGAKVNMSNAPIFDTPDSFNPTYLHLADISGTGATDILYLGRNRCRAWNNLSGNAWGEAREIEPFFPSELPNQLSVVDLLGNGTACIVWSSPLPGYSDAPMRYIDLMGGKKPYIMCGYKNNLGKETSILYKSSSYYYLKDKQEGLPWITKLPFPVQCVSRVEVRETVTNACFVNEYRYHHGYYDHAEREFRGFGMVEHTDTETFDNFVKNTASNIVDVEPLHQPPVLTKTWYHIGAYVRHDTILKQFEPEYYRNTDSAEYRLPEPEIEINTTKPYSLSAEELREAYRACKSMVLREEVYALDGTGQASQPYYTAEHNCWIRLLQTKQENRHAVFLVHESESINYHYERNPVEPRVAHTLHLEIDEVGNVKKSAGIVYPRARVNAGLPQKVKDEQARLGILLTENEFTDDIKTDAAYRLRLTAETSTYELTGKQPGGRFFTLAEVRDAVARAATFVPSGSGVQKRLLKRTRMLYLKNDLSGPLPLRQIESLGLAYEIYRLASTTFMLNEIYGSRVNGAMLEEGGYRLSANLKALGLFSPAGPDDEWWAPSGTTGYPDNPEQHFYLPDRYIDPFNKTTRVTHDPDYHLYIMETEDALGNKTSVESFDFRVLAPEIVKDSNGNYSEVCFDILGLVVGMALKGKGDEADDLNGFRADLTQAEIDGFFTDPAAQGADLLQHATSRFVYDFSKFPAVAGVILRETHHQETLQTGVPSKLQYGFEYSDGLGHIAMKKAQAEPGMAKQLDAANHVVDVDTTPDLCWVGTGRTVLNNKGKPVKQYEPYFSATHRYENARELVEIGVTPVMYYDPVGRLIRTDFPNGTFSRVEFDAWLQKTYDANDTVKDTDWYEERSNGPLAADPAESEAAVKTALHYDTPLEEHHDSLGRNVYSLAHNRFTDIDTGDVVEEQIPTFIKLDIEGNQQFIEDARNNRVMEYKHDMLGGSVYQHSMDAGEHWVLNDCLGKPIYQWDIKDTMLHFRYDALRRNTELEVTEAGRPAITAKRTVYGESAPAPQLGNLRGQAWKQYDGGGVVFYDGYDFKGNLMLSRRQLVVGYQQTTDWTDIATVALEPAQYLSETSCDALNRPVLIKTPDQSVIKHVYNEASLLNEVRVSVRGGPAEQYVQNIDYNEKGQRTRILYGNGVSTSYEYDPLTFRVKHTLTTRNNGAGTLQNLCYTYDPSGNITRITDDAQPTIYYDGMVVRPDSDYTYDALYRLVRAAGREHEGQNMPVNQYDANRRFNSHPNDGSKMRCYVQHYTYDKAGNMLKMIHRVANNTAGNWTRTFTCQADNNRLDSTRVGSALPDSYRFDPHGNMISMPHLHVLDWNYENHLQSVNRSPNNQQSDFNKAWYVYDASGQRVRKVVVFPNDFRKERIYLGSVEIYREISGGTVTLERETLHVMDDRRRIALVDTKTRENSKDISDLQPLARYQLDNHLGTACVELDDAAQVISYEEYYPFGSTSYQARRTSGVEVPEKRYRYTGKERDEETGLYYHGARYYAPWLGRWVSCDPAGLVDGANLYQYARNNPVKYKDSNGFEASVNYDTGKDWEKGIGKAYPPEKGYVVGDCTVIKKGSGGSVIDHWIAQATKWGYNIIGTIEDKTMNLTTRKYLRDSGVFRKGEIVRKLESYLEQMEKHMKDMNKKKYFNTKTGAPLEENLRLLVKTTSQKRFAEFQKILSNTLANFNKTHGTNIKATVQRRQGNSGQAGSASASTALGLGIGLVVGAVASNLIKSEQTKENIVEGTTQLALAGAEWVQGVGLPGVRAGLGVAGEVVRQHGAKALTAGGAAFTAAAGAAKGAVAALTAEVSAGAAATAAVTTAAVVAAAGAVTWAVEDTRRALNGEKTMTDVAMETWGSKGFVGTLSATWHQIRH